MYPPAVCAQEVCRDGSLLAVCPYAAWGAAPARGDVGSRALRLRGGARALRGNQTAAEGKAAAHTQGGGAGPVPGGGDTSAPLKTKRARRKPRAEGAGGADEAGSGSASSAARLSSSPGRGGAHRADAGAARAAAASSSSSGSGARAAAARPPGTSSGGAGADARKKARKGPSSKPPRVAPAAATSRWGALGGGAGVENKGAPHGDVGAAGGRVDGGAAGVGGDWGWGMGDDGCSPTSQVTSLSAGRATAASVSSAVRTPAEAAAGRDGSGAVAGGRQGAADGGGATTSEHVDAGADSRNKSADGAAPPGAGAAPPVAANVSGGAVRTPGFAAGEGAGRAWARGGPGSVGGGGGGRVGGGWR